MQDEDQTPEPVVFRVFPEGDVIALFPELTEPNGNVSSYMHVGQHGAASYAGVIDRTRPATPEEYAPLARELSSAPYHYNLVIRRRRPSRRLAKREA